MENRKDSEVGRVNVTDRDDRGTRNWEATYFIANDPNGNFAIATDPGTNQGIVTVVKVMLDPRDWIQSESVWKGSAVQIPTPVLVEFE